MHECYWPGAPDWHGAFRGPIEQYIPWVRGRLQEYERTQHRITNVFVELQDDGRTARGESYCVAFHLSRADHRPPTEMFVGLRYVDRFEKRGDEWRIAARVCTFD